MVSTLSQWLLCFFFYSFCGWIWECGYVSIRQHEWVARGFLRGPILPIYGFGAILILLSTAPVQNDCGLIFLLGMAVTTILEYGTGIAMESLFHTRYWDYSNRKWNVKGYICPIGSLTWGAFSVLLVKVLHPPIGRIVCAIPPESAAFSALVMTICLLADTICSYERAMGLPPKRPSGSSNTDSRGALQIH